MIKHAWLVVTALALVLATPAQARKECRPAAAGAGEEAADPDADWPHDVQYGWHHESDSADWVHQRGDEDDDAGGDAASAASWVHETDYGWWAAVPRETLHEVEDDPVPTEDEDALEDCTVSRGRNECVVLANQLARYQFQLALAIERDNPRWEASLRETIERLENRGALRDCSWVEPSLRERIIVTVNEVIKAVGVASQVAAMMYRMGLF